jgi:hypothetical protein
MQQTILWKWHNLIQDLLLTLLLLSRASPTPRAPLLRGQAGVTTVHTSHCLQGSTVRHVAGKSLTGKATGFCSTSSWRP